LEDGTLLNAEIIRQGYGHALTRYPFSRMEEFRRLEREAREQGRGLWANAVKGE
jgi:endonuclease YncB( thermonuclease family)